MNHINKYVSLSETEVHALSGFIDHHHYRKKEFLLKEGQVSRHIHFVEKGCLRMYFINNKSVEQITQFAIDHWWITDYFSFTDKTPSPYYIQTVEKSDIISIESAQFDKMLTELPQLERYFRIIMQRAVAASQLRSKYLYEMSKEEFYNHFCTSFPGFVQRIPQYMIASYLGLTPEYVSELRKKKP